MELKKMKDDTTIDQLPEECVREILCKLSDHRDVENAGSDRKREFMILSFIKNCNFRKDHSNNEIYCVREENLERIGAGTTILVCDNDFNFRVQFNVFSRSMCVTHGNFTVLGSSIDMDSTWSQHTYNKSIDLHHSNRQTYNFLYTRRSPQFLRVPPNPQQHLPLTQSPHPHLRN